MGEVRRSQRVLFVSVPFEEVVGEILTKVDDSYMGVTLKRMMLRAASRVAERLELDALVTGEAISQVSSQTPAEPLGDRPGYRHPGAAPADRQPQAGHHRHRPADRHRRVRPAHAGILRVISVNPTTQAKPYRVEHEESKFDMAVLERALERATQRTVDRVIDELGQDLQVEEVGEVLPGQIVIDIRHPDAQEDEPLALEGVEVQALPFYAINSRFKELDANRQYLLYCDKGVMSRLHAHHLLNEGHTNVRVYRPA